jgi:GH43 family beta-xylosidase
MKTDTFYNLITDGADPWVYKHTDGWYYMTRTTGGNVQLWRSRTFTSWDTSENRSLWAPPGPGQTYHGVWAPEIHFINSCWYVYFAAVKVEGGNNQHRMYVLENTNADPFTGSFTFKGQLNDSADKWAIDGTVLQHPFGQLYFIWSGWEGDVNVSQILYIAKLSNPWTIGSERVEIARPIYDWETNAYPHINEGPQVAIRNDVISLVYSASGSWTNTYCLGLITASINSDLMNPASWKKHPEPIFQSTSNIFGPGHHSFTRSPDDREDWIIYHSARFSGAGWNRQIRAQQFSWNYDSTPNLGQPVDRNIPIPVPSGDPFRDRYQAPDACVSNQSSSTVSRSTASNQSTAICVDDEASSATFTVFCQVAGSYVIAIRNCNGSADKTPATHWLTINNENPREITVEYSGWGLWSGNFVRTNLVPGANTLIFKKGKDKVEIDAIEVFLDEVSPVVRL